MCPAAQDTEHSLYVNYIPIKLRKACLLYLNKPGEERNAKTKTKKAQDISNIPERPPRDPFQSLPPSRRGPLFRLPSHRSTSPALELDIGSSIKYVICYVFIYGFFC